MDNISNIEILTSGVKCHSKKDVNRILFECRHYLSVRSNNVLIRNKLTDLDSLMPWINGERTDFMLLRNCGKKSSDELMRFINLLQDIIDPSIINRNVTTGDVTLSPEKNTLTDIDEYIVPKFIQLYDKLSLRAANILIRYKLNNYKSFAVFISLPGNDFRALKNCGLKTAIELNNMAEMLRTYLYISNNCENLCDDSLPFCNEIDYTTDENNIISTFYEANNRWPFFFIVTCYFRHSTSVSDKIFSQIYRINNAEVVSIHDISQQYGISDERVRQNIKLVKEKHNITLKKILSSSGWDYYSENYHRSLLNPNDVIDMDICEKIASEEQLCSPYTVASIIQLQGNELMLFDKQKKLLYNFYSTGIEYPILYSPTFKSYRFALFLSKLKRLDCLKKTKGYTISIDDSFVCKKEYWLNSKTLSEDEKKTLVILLSAIAKIVLSSNTRVENGNVIFMATKIDYAEKVYQILKATGKQLHINEITRLVNEPLTSSEKLTIQQVKSHICRDRRITAIGKSSFYGLNNSSVNRGSIRELTIKYLSKKSNPIEIGDLVKAINVLRPYSSEKSIRSIITQTIDSGELVISFEGYVGLALCKYDDDFVIIPRSFHEWLQLFKDFVIKNQRYPFSDGSKLEGYLYRWHLKASKLITLSDVEILAFDQLNTELADYPRSKMEYGFLQQCELYKQYIIANHRHPEANDPLGLSRWFLHAVNTLHNYTDQRNKYLTDLLRFISQYLSAN